MLFRAALVGYTAVGRVAFGSSGPPPPRPEREEDYNGLPMISVAVFFVSGKQEAAMVSLDRWINLAE